eukprot:11090217-Ditylum_brightwellii.AAC.1
MERSKQNKHVVCNKDDDVDNGDDNGDDDSVDDCDDDDDDDDCDVGADKHLTHHSQAADCCLMEKRKQNKHVVCNEDNDIHDVVYNGVDNGDNDSVDNIDDNGDDSADKLLIYLLQAADCCMME